MTTISGSPVTTNLYSTVATLKVRLSISDTADDTTLGLILTGVCRAIDGHCGQHFYKDAQASIRYFTPVDTNCVFIDPLVSVTTLETDGGQRTYSTTWAATDYDLLPANAGDSNRPYTWIETTYNSSYRFPTVSRGVKLTGVFGWPAVPAAIGEAALLWSERLYKRKDAPFGIASFIEAGEMRLIREIDPDVVTLLKPFVRLF
jgi:hypothetical protein